MSRARTQDAFNCMRRCAIHIFIGNLRNVQKQDHKETPIKSQDDVYNVYIAASYRLCNCTFVYKSTLASTCQDFLVISAEIENSYIYMVEAR